MPIKNKKVKMTPDEIEACAYYFGASNLAILNSTYIAEIKNLIKDKNWKGIVNYVDRQIFAKMSESDEMYNGMVEEAESFIKGIKKGDKYYIETWEKLKKIVESMKMKVIKMNKAQFESYIKGLTKKILKEQNQNPNASSPSVVGDIVLVKRKIFQDAKIEQKIGTEFSIPNYGKLKIVRRIHDEDIGGKISPKYKGGWYCKIIKLEK